MAANDGAPRVDPGLVGRSGLEVEQARRDVEVLAHDRRKDFAWREDLDRERYEIENELRRLERGRVAAEVDATKTEAVKKRYDLYSELFGVDHARLRFAEELGSAFSALDAAEVAPGEILPGELDGPDDPSGSGGAEGEEGAGEGGGGRPDPPNDGGDGGDDDDDPEPRAGSGEGGEAAELPPETLNDEPLDVVGRDLEHV